MAVIPVMLQDKWFGDFTLSCPICDHPITFPLFCPQNKPKYCQHCGVEFKWE